MPFTVETTEGILIYRCSGVYDRRDIHGIQAHLARVESDLARVPDRICDLSEVGDFDADFLEVATATEEQRKRRYANPSRVAFVAVKPVQVGFGRMYQTLADCDSVAYHVFPTMAAALEWLRRSPSEVGSKR